MQPRMLGQDRFLRLVQRGAAVILRGNLGHVYRSTDQRRGLVGRIDASCVRHLITEDVLTATPPSSDCYVWSGKATSMGEDRGELSYSQGGEGAAVAASWPSRFDKLLAFEASDAKRVRLAKAALRFCHAMEEVNSGGQFTMNWSFVPRGARRKGSGGAGNASFGACSRRDLAKLADVMEPDDLHLLQAVFVFEKPVHRIGLERGLGRRVITRSFRQAVRALADVYDQEIAAEFRS